jgi:hypothetical protein
MYCCSMDNLRFQDFGSGKDLDMFHLHMTVRTHSMGQCVPEQFTQLKEGVKCPINSTSSTFHPSPPT